jgi:hypothetical protein
MTTKKPWAKSSSGPDEIDVETMMRALGALHSGHVGLMFSPLGTGSIGGVLVTAVMTFDVLPGSSLPAAVTAEGKYPCSECKTFWGHVFSVLHGLDYQIGRVYQNETLWK